MIFFRGILAIIAIYCYTFYYVLYASRHFEARMYIAVFVTSVPIWYIGRYLNNKPTKVVNDPVVGSKVIYENIYSFLFIKMEYWAILFIVMGLVSIGYDSVILKESAVSVYLTSALVAILLLIIFLWEYIAKGPSKSSNMFFILYRRWKGRQQKVAVATNSPSSAHKSIKVKSNTPTPLKRKDSLERDIIIKKERSKSPGFLSKDLVDDVKSSGSKNFQPSDHSRFMPVSGAEESS